MRKAPVVQYTMRLMTTNGKKTKCQHGKKESFSPHSQVLFFALEYTNIEKKNENPERKGLIKLDYKTNAPSYTLPSDRVYVRIQVPEVPLMGVTENPEPGMVQDVYSPVSRLESSTTTVVPAVVKKEQTDERDSS